MGKVYPEEVRNKAVEPRFPHFAKSFQPDLAVPSFSGPSAARMGAQPHRERWTPCYIAFELVC